ncbi:hypothetical protein [Falsigemmobacter faecalis]|uniref:Uncharacterized protein n=1 Tax=Falsigemmobacter faecalis TaxID=2488730 RepID=A0A3P3DVR6_9RHOB|nr:hypothetical protein [Falsigemmobacter faecalis]RRH78231.1 hypothetical protein EG244_01955 [Falsigemmobacter faecalis]
MLRSALAVAAFVAAAPAFAGSVPVVSAPATVNPPVAPPPAPAVIGGTPGPAVVIPSLSLQVITALNAQLVGPTGGGAMPPGGMLVQLPNATPVQMAHIERLLALIDSGVIDTSDIFKLSGNVTSR